MRKYIGFIASRVGLLNCAAALATAFLPCAPAFAAAPDPLFETGAIPAGDDTIIVLPHADATRPLADAAVFDIGAIISPDLPAIAEKAGHEVAYGPADPAALAQADGFVDAGSIAPKQASFGKDVAAVKWELAAVVGYYTAINGPKLFDDPVAPHVHHEGWFGRDTYNVGVDKLAHSYSAFVLSDLFYGRIKRKRGDAPGVALTAAALGSAIMLYTEAYDSIEADGGWSWEDVAMNGLGAGFSLLRNSVPGMKEKVDFRLMIVPNGDIINVKGKGHFQQQRYFLALKGAGFDGLKDTPLRFVDLDLGYYGDDFLLEDRAAGVTPKRRIFVGLSLNLGELLFRNARSPAGRAMRDVLHYWQPPYTMVNTAITD